MRTSTMLSLFIALTTCSSAAAQTIQLPTLSTFSVDTTVVVPDSGGAVVGGMRRASSGINRFNGLPRQQAIGVERQAAGMSVTAKIHDPAEADEALLKEARAGCQRGGAGR